MREYRYTTPHGIQVTRTLSKANFRKGLVHLLRDLDRHRGFYLSSGYEYPGRYSRWDFASTCPPLEIVAYDRRVELRPLNERGRNLAGLLQPVLASHPHWEEFGFESGILAGRLKPLPALFPEEERSKQPSVFTILRAVMEEFRGEEDSRLGLVGAFGYDLLFQFEPIEKKLPRDGHKDLHLFFCDDIWLMDRKKEQIERCQYDFTREAVTTRGLPRTGEKLAPPPRASRGPSRAITHLKSTWPRWKRCAKACAAATTTRWCSARRSALPTPARPRSFSRKVQQASPSPYEFLIQFGEEQLVGASPEMFMRVEGQRVETCPIAGTAQRTGDPLQDAENIRELLKSAKEESELTMCTDVDRNDKSRVCEPGSVKVIGRRLIESYAGVFHTVDHVEGFLQEGFDSLDAFLSHMWAVTLIGAPKKAAAQHRIAGKERARVVWRRCRHAQAQRRHQHRHPDSHGVSARRCGAYPVGATLLYDSVPAMEERETHLKATGFFRALGNAAKTSTATVERERAGAGTKLLLVDNDDCFIHTLANYARQTGAHVVTYRHGLPSELIERLAPNLILISPGPGRPADFGVPDLVKTAVRLGVPVFGVCLGLQGIVEAFGGELGVLDYPVHGKPSVVRHRGVGVFEGLPEEFLVGRYHSLFARRETFPACLEVTAQTEDGVIMGVRHRELPIEAVQFHPESLLTATDDHGLKLMENAVRIGRPVRA